MNGYDNWLHTTPEDEEDTAVWRNNRKAAAEEERANRPRYYSAQFINGRKVYEEDFICDPLSKQGFD